jgi:hypothetical protein
MSINKKTTETKPGLTLTTEAIVNANDHDVLRLLIYCLLMPGREPPSHVRLYASLLAKSLFHVLDDIGESDQLETELRTLGIDTTRVGSPIINWE